jgi:uncharacterized protein
MAQEQSSRFPLHTIRASGEATISAQPDQARITVGVTTIAATAEEASSQNAAKIASTLNSLKSLVKSAGEMRTTSYSVEPQYKYVTGKAPAISGYQANQTIQLTLNDVQLVGKVIDAASGAGANNINQIEFRLKDDHAVKEQALAKATADAKSNAETIAKALGVTVTGVAYAETNEAEPIRPRAMPMMMKAQASDAPTQIESGTVDTHVSVTVYLQVQ